MNYVMNKISFREHYYYHFESNFAEKFKIKIQSALDPLDYIFGDAVHDCFYFEN